MPEHTWFSWSQWNAITKCHAKFGLNWRDHWETVINLKKERKRKAQKAVFVILVLITVTSPVHQVLQELLKEEHSFHFQFKYSKVHLLRGTLESFKYPSVRYKSSLFKLVLKYILAPSPTHPKHLWPFRIGLRN